MEIDMRKGISAWQGAMATGQIGERFVHSTN
jgi:hypothetical protein